MDNIKKKEELNEVIENNGKDNLVVVKFSATWCSPCRILEKTIETIEGDYDNVKFYNVDIDELPDLSDEHSITSVPVLLYYKGSLQVDRTTGAIPERALRQKIEENNEK